MDICMVLRRSRDVGDSEGGGGAGRRGSSLLLLNIADVSFGDGRGMVGRHII